VILVFDFGSFGRRKAEPPHNVLQLFNRLCQWMQPANAELRTWQRWVELSPALFGLRRRLQPLLGRLESDFNLRFDLVEPLAGRGFVIFGNRAKALLNRLQLPFRGAQVLDTGRLDRLRVGSGGERSTGIGGQGVEVGEKVREQQAKVLP
jgi:hypothetical protein